MTTSPAIPADSATAPRARYVSHTTQVVEVLEAADRCAVTDRRRVGALIGTFAPAVGEQLKLAGDVFLNLVQMIVVPLVFPLIVLGIARMDSAKKVGRMAAKAILYFEIVTTIILLMAVALAKLLDIGSGAPVAAPTKLRRDPRAGHRLPRTTPARCPEERLRRLRGGEPAGSDRVRRIRRRRTRRDR